jgi:hypothetical protein
VDNQLAYIDQGSFLALRALGHEPVQQLVWVYDHDVNVERLREVHRNLGHTLLGRRIERSPLPFGRHRWVSAPRQADLDVCSVRPRSELMLWADEQGITPVDPEHGPAWRMAVVPFVEGGGAVTLVVSHSVADVGATLASIFAAATGIKQDFGYPPPGSRPKGQALREDLKIARQALPEMRTALKAATSVVRDERPPKSQAKTSRPEESIQTHPYAPAIRPTVCAVVPATEWDARAAELGGTSGALVAGFASRLGYLMGRSRPDGSVALQFPVSERGDGDTRANALTGMTVMTNPNEVITSLAAVRSDLKTGLKEVAGTQHKMLAPLPLAPVTPKLVVRKLVGLANSEGPVVGCTNLGDVPTVLTQLDGTDAEYVIARGVEWKVTPSELDQIGNWLLVGSGRVGGKVLLFVTSWQVGAANSKEDLARVVEQALADFGLSGTFVGL